MVASEKLARSSDTHAVTNQPPALQKLQSLSERHGACRICKKEGAGWAEENFQRFRQLVGREESIKLGYQLSTRIPRF